MIRHPHFTQPIFVRFPRPAVLSGREGVERFPPEPDLEFAAAVARRLKALDASITHDQVADLVEGHREDEVRKALGATLRARPDRPLAFFRSALGRRVTAEIPLPSRCTSGPGHRGSLPFLG